MFNLEHTVRDCAADIWNDRTNIERPDYQRQSKCFTLEQVEEVLFSMYPDRNDNVRAELDRQVEIGFYKKAEIPGVTLYWWSQVYSIKNVTKLPCYKEILFSSWNKVPIKSLTLMKNSGIPNTSIRRYASEYNRTSLNRIELIINGEKVWCVAIPKDEW